jgi:hypothetical protein
MKNGETMAVGVVIHEINALERYLDAYLQTNGLTFEKWIEGFGQEPYFTRNQLILKTLAPLQPKRIFEFACAGGFLAKLLLENMTGIERYTCSNFSARVVTYCERQLTQFANCEVKLIDANIVRSRDIDQAKLEQYDAFVTTSFEHIEYDRELIRRFPESRCFVFCVAGFNDPEHFRVFTDPEQIKDRYADILLIRRVEALGREDQKFVVLSWTRPIVRTYR